MHCVPETGGLCFATEVSGARMCLQPLPLPFWLKVHTGLLRSLAGLLLHDFLQPSCWAIFKGPSPTRTPLLYTILSILLASNGLDLSTTSRLLTESSLRVSALK